MCRDISGIGLGGGWIRNATEVGMAENCHYYWSPPSNWPPDCCRLRMAVKSQKRKFELCSQFDL